MGHAYLLYGPMIEKSAPYIGCRSVNKLTLVPATDMCYRLRSLLESSRGNAQAENGRGVVGNELT